MNSLYQRDAKIAKFRQHLVSSGFVQGTGGGELRVSGHSPDFKHLHPMTEVVKQGLEVRGKFYDMRTLLLLPTGSGKALLSCTKYPLTPVLPPTTEDNLPITKDVIGKLYLLCLFSLV